MRILYGLVLFQEILFLLYFNHLIFDPIPYMDVEFPMITFFLGIWAFVALAITIGYRTQISTLVNYVFWIVFVSFTPMQRDFDGGFDQFMIGMAFFLIFLPAERSFSIDNLIAKLKFSTAAKPYNPPNTASLLCYVAPIIICLGFLYFDSAIHKLFSEHWRNGLGSWLPSTHPYYISRLDMSWLLNQQYLNKTIGYIIIVFQFCFIWLYLSKSLRWIALGIGLCLHIGITITFNIYPFGMGMLALYPLLIPFNWWQMLSNRFCKRTPSLIVYFDEQCPLCNRTVVILRHFDLFHAINFRGLQSHANTEIALQDYKLDTLLTDLYAVNAKQHVFNGLDTYIQILKHMLYTTPLALIFSTPGIRQIAVKLYRRIADNRKRIVCNESCLPLKTSSISAFSIYRQIFENYGHQHPKKFATKLSKLFIFVLILQLNSTLHYGLAYRFGLVGTVQSSNPVVAASNSLLTMTTTFLGITPHALYLDDHFKGYNHVLGITYLDNNGKEKWLPFVDSSGRMVAPNWGRVHSMWANIAVTPNIDNHRLQKLLAKVTAFWGIKLGLDLNNTKFIIKLKKIQSPSQWQKNLRYNNLAQSWLNIGNATWKGRQFTTNLPDDIEAL